MPFVLLKTNLPTEKMSQEFHMELSAKLAEVLGKPHERVSVTVEGGCRMSRGGSLDPLCEMRVVAIGLDSGEKTGPVARTITAFITDRLGVPPARVVMFFTSVPPYQVSVAGELMG